tara:strand:- start:17643 stop:20699 length:3057 start_codon:yes stop_codon:yes gene_type:complete
MATELAPDVIYVGGDIVHSKTQGISPELIDSLCWWFNGLSSIAPVHVILGNHDGLLQNKSRQDAISPILSAMNNPDIYLYKDSGTYPVDNQPGFSWNVFSCFDEKGWSEVHPDDNDVNIALFHGCVQGSKTDSNWELDGEVTVSFFDGYDYALLADIHHVQFLTDDKKIAYCGSALQQNYGESTGKGFLFWDIRGKDDFDVTFHELPHDKPFITIDWKGSVKKVLIESAKHPNGSRFRIRSDQSMTQATSKQLQNELLTFKNAAEVVFKSESAFNSSDIEISGKNFTNSDNLRDAKTQKRLIREYYDNVSHRKAMFDKFDNLIDKYLSQISLEDERLRGVRWQINNFKFNNTFAYGPGNMINFDNLPGITGIFGKNTKGKSSIIGSLMYGLFNTTDRGPIKNIHIVNNRKNSCSTTVEFSMNGKKFRLKRKTVKNHTKKNDVYATTGLSLHEIDSNGDIISDLSGEQRRSTEKIVRNMIGTSEDFLMTSLASQGQMNTFIREKATSRKMILTNFLDLNIFDKLHDLAKSESQETRSKAKIMNHLDWDSLIDDQASVIEDKESTLLGVENLIKTKREILERLSIELATSGGIDVVIPDDVFVHEEKISKNNLLLTSCEEELSNVNNSLKKENERILRIKRVKNDFPIKRLRESLSSQTMLEKSLLSLTHECEVQKNILDSQNRSAKKLLEVPCGDKFLSCKFIKESHSDKGSIASQKDVVDKMVESLSRANDAFEKIKAENIEDKIKKFDKISEKETELFRKISDLEIERSKIQSRIKEIERIISDDMMTLEDMRSRVIDEESSSECAKIRSNISDLRREIESLDCDRLACVGKITRAKIETSRLKKEKSDFDKLRKDLKIYDMFIQAMSKKGIPLQIMMSQLPLINSEILKILQGVTGFTVELVADSGSNAMDIFIDYGDSKRVIELASGMEKMMASLAIRVALINVSSLPKTNMLIIDEGFGALDETNIEACSRLLESLKKWFKNIIVISHVDAIKDSVDSSLEILKNEKDTMVFHG